ncbi:hypothetical protein [Azospirillum halopraeferens]|uniref:hypothetical protein n=1 Tax=Azospirillum halopraeferens TaxID=34010 RepID=UPI0004274107|nr:hypothetical protein [Azospirillum halopraeferens]
MMVPESGLLAGLSRQAAARALESLGLLADGLPAGLTCRLLGPGDADAMRRLRADVIAGLTDPDHYRVAGEVGDFVADHLGRCGMTAGLFAGGDLVAYGSLGLPGPGDANRGRDLPLPEAELPLVAHMASCMIRADHRGLGLHHRLIGWRLALADGLGRRHVLTTVSPRNHQSWAHLAAHGILAKRVVIVAGGLARLLVHRDGAADPLPDPRTLELCAPGDLAAADGPPARGGWVWARGRIDDAAGTRYLAICARPRDVGV